MSKIIWKFPLELKDESLIEMPTNSEILCVQMQDGDPYLWAVVDESAPKVMRRIYTRGTGQSLGRAQGWPYVGTFQSFRLVFHVFAGDSVEI